MLNSLVIDDLKYWIAFSRIRLLGTIRFRLLDSYFPTMEEAWRASRSQLKAAGLDSRTLSAIEKGRQTIEPDAERDRLGRQGVEAFSWNHSAYPSRLKEIPDPPPVLFVKGSLTAGDERSVAVVGARKATAYGREVTAAFATDLARNGVTIVSGLDRGIDTVAHRATLNANGRTLAVLAHGLDRIYPPENAHLAHEIAEIGALISEHPLGAHPDSHLFPRRNRLMSGLTLGTLVVEAGTGSGTLWTVRHALEQNREVFCVPGSIFSPASKATNELIQQGAKLVMNYKDVLVELNLNAVGSPIELNLPNLASNSQKAKLLQYVSHEPTHIDKIGRGLALSVSQVSSALTLMELRGLVKQIGGMHYIRTREMTTTYGG